MEWDEGRISFRRLAEDDLPRMHAWLNTPHVNQWYSEGDGSYATIVDHYGPMIRGEKPTSGYVMLLDAEPVGFIQWYLIEDHTEYGEALQVEPGAAGVDLFIGEPDLVHRGLGPAGLGRFLRAIV